MRALRLVGILLLLCEPLNALAHQERLILAAERRGCTLRLEADDEAGSLRVRVVRHDPTCRVSKEDLQAFLRLAFAETDPPRLRRVYSSLYIGRLVDFPWLAAHLASTAYMDPRWDRRRGRSLDVGINTYVAALLSRADVTEQIGSAIEGSGYVVGSAMVEKVLVGGLRDLPAYEGGISPGKVPFDAQVWFTLEKR